MDTKNKTSLPINLFEKQNNEAKSGFQIKVIRKDKIKSSNKEKK